MQQKHAVETQFFNDIETFIKQKKREKKPK